jgi:hypothetical protein
MPNITNGVAAAQPQGLVVEYILVRRSVISVSFLTAPDRDRSRSASGAACGSTSPAVPRPPHQHVYAVGMVG